MDILINKGNFRIIQIAGDLETLDEVTRTCYQSRGEGHNVEEFLRNLLTVRKHESIFEHSLLTVEFNNVSRGFCYDDETEVLTKDGWKLFKDTTDEDEFFTVNMDNFKHEYQKRIGVTKEWWDTDLIYGESTLVNFAITPNHRTIWFHYDSRVDKKWRVDKAEYVYGRRVKFNRGLFSDWIGEDFEEEFEGQKDLNFARFMGLFISDGNIYKGENSGGRVTISQTKERGRQYIREVLTNLNWNFKELDKEFRVNNTKLYTFLRKYFMNKKTYEGRVPRWIRMAGKEYIEAFLEGVIVGDGTVGKDKHIKVYTASYGAAGDYQECIMKVGKAANIYEDSRVGSSHLVNGSPLVKRVKSYIVSITNNENHHLFNKKNWSKKKYSGFVYCVTVPNNTLYVRRKGKALWSGNTHQIVRHRLASFSQESTRYVDPHKGGYKVIMPEGKDLTTKVYDVMYDSHNAISVEEFLQIQEKMYAELLKDGWKKEDARHILPVGIKSQIVVSANFREWRHIFNLRTSDHAHWEIRRVMQGLLHEVRKIVPVIFDDIGTAMPLLDEDEYTLDTDKGTIVLKKTDSSNIEGYSWNCPKEEGLKVKCTGVLDVHFKSGGLYSYSNVPSNIGNDFVKAESKGKYLNSHIKSDKTIGYEKINIK